MAEVLMKASTFKMGEIAHKIKERTTLASRGLRPFEDVVNYEKVRGKGSD